MKENPTRVTKNDILRFAYGEILSSHEQALVREAIATNADFHTYYEEILSMQQSLDQATKRPSKGFLARLHQVLRKPRAAESDSLQSV
ncbi:MAG: hypothetical protein ACFCUI_00700 [Bernardetiaceae bacterium]